MGHQVSLNPYNPIGERHSWRQIQLGSTDPMMECKKCGMRARYSYVRHGGLGSCPGRKKDAYYRGKTQ